MELKFRPVEFTEMSLNADRAGKLLLGFPTTCKDHPRTLGSHPLRLSDEEMSSVTRPSGTITAGRAASWRARLSAPLCWTV